MCSRLHLDFAKLSKGKVCDFDELKSISLNDYMDLMPYKDDYDERLKYIKKRYKHYYNQVQEQLMCRHRKSQFGFSVSIYI